MNPLESATVEELWAELSKRFAAALLMTDEDHKTEPSSRYGLRWHGGKAAALGLADIARGRLLQSIVETSQ